MKRVMWTLALSFCICSTASSEVRVARDSGGMPRCIEETTSGEGYLFAWASGESYHRRIKVVSLSLASARARLFQGYSPLKASCDQWQLISSVPRMGWKFIETDFFPRSQNQIGGVSIPRDVSFALTQVEAGGNTFRNELTATDFLRQKPIKTFDRSMNRALTKMYGNEFVGRIYSEFVTNDVQNKKFRNDVDQELERSFTTTTATQPSTPIKLIMVSGLMQDPNNNRLKSVRETLAAQGFRVEFAKTNPVGSVDENAKALYAQLRSNLEFGEKIILVAGSKGTAEMFAALTMLKPVHARGHVLAAVSLSGTIEGSFVIDWGLKLPQNLFIKPALKMQASKQGFNLSDMRAFESLKTSSLAEKVAYYAKYLPRDIQYFSLIGVPISNYGLMKDPAIQQLQNQITRAHILDHGANDGYIEFPGTSLSRSWGINAVELVVDGSHIILDGLYHSPGRVWDLSQADDQARFIGSVFRVILKRISPL